MPHAVILAATLKVLVPAFTLETAPSVFASSLPPELARTVEAFGCATPTHVGQLNDTATGALRTCNGAPNCLSAAARFLNMELIAAGHVKKVDDGFAVTVTVIETASGKTRPPQEFRVAGKLSDVPKVFRNNATAICQAIDPEWQPVVTVIAKPVPPPANDELALLPDFDLPDAPAAQAKAVTPPPPSVTPAPIATTSPPPEATPKRPPPAPVATIEARTTVATPAVTPPPPAPTAAPETRTAPAAPTVTPPPPTVAATPPATTATPEVPKAAREVTVKPAPKKIPWVLITGGGAVVAGAVGLGMGLGSRSIWSDDQPIARDGVVRHSITHAQASQANTLAIGTNVLFGIAGALGVTTGLLMVSNGGLGLNGQF